MVGPSAFDGPLGEDISPRSRASGKERIDDWVKQTVGISHPPVGSYNMGALNDPMAMPGPDLKARGCGRRAGGRLGNTYTATIALAERGAELIQPTYPS
jgi:hypothetical protein